MESNLERSLKEWERQIDVLKDVELTFLALEAQEKSLEGDLFLKSTGKTIAEKEAQSHASLEWVNFSAGLAGARANYNHERRILELRQKQYEAYYLETKIENEIIRRST